MIKAHSMSPVDVRESLHRSGLVFSPPIDHPLFGMDMLRHLIHGGALYHSADTLNPVGRHFGDGQYLWAHLRTIMGFYNFRVDHEHTQVRLGGIISMLMAGRAIFGIEGIWRLWQAIFDECFSDIRVDVDPQEPVSTLRGDARGSRGWDQFFGGYPLWVLHTLEYSVDQKRAMPFFEMASRMPAEAFLRQAAEGLLRLTYEVPAGTYLSNGEPSQGLELDGSLAKELLPQSPGAYQDTVDTSGFVGPKIGEAGSRWSKSMQRLLNSPMGQIPRFPVDGYNASFLRELAPIQRYGYVRSSGLPHTGIDLQASQGTSILAMYPGVVVAMRNDQKEGNGDQMPEGNFVSLRHDFTVGQRRYKATTEYYHMDTVAKLKVGDKVNEGAVLGTVGNTGASRGAHLHLTVRVAELDSMGRSMFKKTIDPARVLEVGLVRAARESGVSIGEAAKPSLAVGGVTLSSMLGGRMFNPYNGTQDHQAFLQSVVDLFKKNESGGGGQSGETPLEQLNRLGAGVLDEGLTVFGPKSRARDILDAAYSALGVPKGTAGTVLDALHAGVKEIQNGNDSQAVIQATLDNLSLSEDVKKAALTAAVNVAAKELGDEG